MSQGSPDKPKQRIRSFSNFFPFGPAPFVILVMTVAAGVYLLAHPIQPSESNLHLSTFTSIHSDAYIDAARTFEQKHPEAKVKIELVHRAAYNSRLRSALWADLDVPDLVEIEISEAGSSFCT